MLLIGNCQAEAVYNCLVANSTEVRLRVMISSRLHEVLGSSHVKAMISRYVDTDDMKQMLREGMLVPQPSVADLVLDDSDTVVLSLFHERPLYRHTEEGYFLTCTPDLLQLCRPELSAWIEKEFEQVERSDTYFDNLLNFLDVFREKRNDCPIVIIKRLSHYPSLGQCHCSNAWWMENWAHWSEYEKIIGERYANVHFVDLDKVVSGLLHSVSIEELLPNAFLKKQGDEYIAVRDTEHLGAAVWHRVADLLEAFRKIGRVKYNRYEESVHDWSHNHCVAHVSRGTIHSWLESGELMLQRKALTLMLMQGDEAPAEVLLRHVDSLQFHYRFFLSLWALMESDRGTGCNKLIAALQMRNEQLHPEGSYLRDLFGVLFDQLTCFFIESEKVTELPVIGEGMQCRVFEWGAGKVLKRLRDQKQVREYYRRRYPEFSKPGNDFSSASALCYTASAQYGVELVARNMLHGSMLGNPQAAGKAAIVQDAVVPCVTAFSSGTRNLDDEVLNSFLEINKSLWAKGIFEVTMSLDKYGFLDDELVLYDFFEIGTNRDDWRMLGELRWWRQCNRFFVRFKKSLLEDLDEQFGLLFRQHDLLQTTEEAPEDCRLHSLRKFIKQIKKSGAGFPWLN